jgi:hypothetical protein
MLRCYSSRPLWEFTTSSTALWVPFRGEAFFTLSALPLGSFHSTPGGEVTGAGAGPGPRGQGAMPVSGMRHALGCCPRGHCRSAACPGDRIFRSRIRSRSRILGSNHFAFPSLADRIGSTGLPRAVIGAVYFVQLGAWPSSNAPQSQSGPWCISSTAVSMATYFALAGEAR